MRRGTALTIALSIFPTAALAEGTMPQMDFHNPLTTDQVLWMVVILVVLYFTLSRWGLPEIGKVLQNRDSVIARDLAEARAAKAAADQAIAALNATMRSARANAQAEIATAVNDAKIKAEATAHALNARLEAQLAESEKQINAALALAMAAIKPVAEETAAALLLRLTGQTPDHAVVAPQVDAAFATREAA